MKRRLLRLLSSAFVTWLRQRMDPAGKASLHALEARMMVLIDALPEGDGAPELEGLCEASVLSGLPWLLDSLRAAYPDDWAPVACESLKLLVSRNAVEIAALAQPPEVPVG